MKNEVNAHNAPPSAAQNEATLLRIERDIGRLMLRSGSQTALIEDLCARLAREAIFRCAAVVLWGRDQVIGPAALAGDPEILADLARATTMDHLPDYGRTAIEDPAGPTRYVLSARAGTIFSVRLQHDERLFGILSVSVDDDAAVPFLEPRWWQTLGAEIALGLDRIRHITEIKKAEKALRESEARYRLLADNTLDIIWQMDMDLRITYVNPAVVDILGYAPEEFSGTRLSDHCSPKTLASIRTAVTEGLDEQSRPVRRTLIAWLFHKNGTEVPLEVQARFLFGAGPEPIGIQGTSRDISDRLAAESALHKSEVTLKAALDHSPAGIAISDARGKLQYVNRAGLTIRGKVPEEVVKGIGIDDYVQSWQIRHRDGRLYEKEEVPLTRAVLFGETASAEFLIRRDDGENRLVKANAAPVHASDGTLVAAIVVFMDITDRAVMEETLRRTTDRLSLATQAAGIGIWEWNLESNDLIWDNRMFALYGKDPDGDSPCFEDWQKAVHPDDRNIALQAVEEALAGRQPFNIQFRIRRKDGTVRHIEAHAAVTRYRDGKPEGMIGVNWDITDRVAAEAAAREQKERLQTIMDNIPLMVTFLKPEAQHLWVNRACENMHGWQLSEAPEKDLLAVIYPDPEYRRYVLDFIRRAEGVWQDFEMRIADGSKRLAVWKNVRLTDGSIIGIGEDVTEARQARKRQQELEQQLLQAQRMEAVGRLAGGVAHDFNNLLAVILGYADLVLETMAPSHANYEPLKDIQDAAVRARDLTSQLLAFGRKQMLSIKVLDLNTVVTGFDKLIRRVIGEDILLDLRLFPEPLPVSADISQLEQVLMNLAVNARDAMPEGGRLLIETSRVELDMDYVENTPGTTPGDYALIAVSDSGIGMNRATLQHIFEPFYTTKGKDVGTGLGLSTAYGIVKQHGGNIWAYSEPGEGSTFKVYLPRVSAEKPAETPPAAPQEAVEHGSATILIAEDDPSVRRLTTRILGSKGYRVLAPQNVDDAIDISRSHVGPIDLLLSDVVMPGMTGPELHARLSLDRPEMKVIFMSGYSGEAISRYGVLNHGTYFIQKPFSARTLLAKVAEALTG